MIEVGKPEVTFSSTTNIFEWPALSIKVVVDRITDDGKAEIYFYHHNGDKKDSLLHMGTANLLSSTFQRPFVSALSDRILGVEIDWQTILTYISRDTMEHLRKGEDVVWLDDSYGKTPPEYVLPPLFVKDAVNIIYADRSSAKTLFITLADIALTLPWHDNKIGLDIKPDGRHNILFLDWESNANIIGWQKECLLRGMKLGWCAIPYLHCYRSLADSVHHISKKIREVEADIVIIDSLGMAVMDDLNLTKPAFAFFAALRQLPVTPIIVAHTSKSETTRKTVYGNAFYENEARSIFELSKKQELGSNELLLTMYHRKPPPFAPMSSPFAFRFTFEHDSIKVESSEATSDKREVTDQVPKEIDIVMAIISEASSPMTPHDIVATTKPKISSNNVRQACYQLKKKGKLKFVDGGYIANE